MRSAPRRLLLKPSKMKSRAGPLWLGTLLASLCLFVLLLSKPSGRPSVLDANVPFPDEEYTGGYQQQWADWTGEKGKWVRLPRDPAPILPPDEEEDIPQRPGYPTEVEQRRHREPLQGAVDITGVGEGTERVRAGLEGPWQGIDSPSRPDTTHEGGGLEDNPMRSSIAIKPVTDHQWVDNGDGFPGDLARGNFPGVAPDNPEGTSWYIGMHRDGEETVGQWARRRRNFVRGQQLDLLGADISDVGEDNRDKYVVGAYGPPDSTSWVVGEHRVPQWSDSLTFACGTTTPCKMGDADRGHYFQRDTNPYVDKRRVFDSYAQQDEDNTDKGKDAFPWDPTRHPQLFKKGDCSDGKLRPECFNRPKAAVGDIPARGLQGGHSGQQLRAGRGNRAGSVERMSDADDNWKDWVDKALEMPYNR